MMRQLELLMGKEALRDGLREYLKIYQHGNATWPQLIAILDKHTPADLTTWNKVWVNEPGRPVFTYLLKEENKKIASLTIYQKAENGSTNILPQVFHVALVYANHVEEHTVTMNQKEVVVKGLSGKPMPEFILFNSGGEGYGLFPVDAKMLSNFSFLTNPVYRASAYINMYENMLSEGIHPQQLLSVLRTVVDKESEELNLKQITGYIADIFWKFTLPQERLLTAPALEKELWQTMQQETVANKKKILFKTFQSIALTKDAKDNLYAIWQTQKAPKGVTLSEEDYTSLALSLAVKEYPDIDLLKKELTRIKNSDRQKRLQFIMPALSPNVAVRDSFFYSLKKEQNREKEAWVTLALEYLHHPLRAGTSVQYLEESLALLQQIQLTGDIFFPGSWLQATLGSYQSPEAAQIVRRFLKDHPAYNERLKAKILQAADTLFRAERILHTSK